MSRKCAANETSLLENLSDNQLSFGFAVLFSKRFWALVSILFIFLGLSCLTQVREKVRALRARRAELVSAIDILSCAASALRAGPSGVASASIGNHAVGSADAAMGSGGGATLASVTRSLVQARRLRKQFDRQWGFTPRRSDRMLGTALEVCACVRVCVRVCVCNCVCVGVNVGMGVGVRVGVWACVWA